MVWVRRSSLTLTWWLLAGCCTALFFYQWAHPAGSGSRPLAQGPAPSVSVTTRPAAPVVLPSPARPVRPRVGAVPAAAVSARSSTPAASPSASVSAAPSATPTPAPSAPVPQPLAAAAVSLTVPLPRPVQAVVKASVAVPGAPPWPSLDAELQLHAVVTVSPSP